MLRILPFFEVRSINIRRHLSKGQPEKHLFHVEIYAAARRRNGDDMMKKILALTLAAMISVQGINAFAADTDEIQSYISKINTSNYETIEDVDDAYEEIIVDLVENQDCDRETAEQVFEEFRKMMAESLGKKDEDNKPADDAKPVEDNKTVLKDSSAEVINQLKITKDIELDYDSNVKRAVYAEMVARLVKFGEDFSEEKGYFEFSDVTEENESYHAIAALINAGAVVGVGGGLFEPDSDITINEACAILVRLMGYDSLKQKSEDDIYYFNKASEIGLLKNIKKKSTDFATGADVVTLMYNAMFADVVNEQVNYNGDIFVYTENTFLEEYMNMDYRDDIVYANSKTSIYSGDGAVSEGHLKIGDIVYDFEDIDYLDKYLAKKVRVFFDIDDESGKAVTGLERYNEETVVKSGDIEKYDEKNARIEYTINDGAKDKYENVTEDTAIIFNGVAVDYEHDKKNLLCPDVGELIFLDNNRDGKTDVIFVESYVYYMSSDVTVSMPKLYDANELQPDLELDSDKIEIYQNGEKISYDSIVRDKLIMAAPSRAEFVKDSVSGITYMRVDAENSTHIKIELMSETVSGEVKSAPSNGKMKIDSESYELSETLTKLSQLNINDKFRLPTTGSNVIGFVDKYGYIAIFTVSSYTADLKYGYLKKIIADEESGEELYIAKIFTQDGEHITLVLADKVRVHKKWSESAPLTPDTYTAKSIKASVLAGGDYDRQMVKYALNGDGKLKEIYVADTSVTKDTYGTMDFWYGDDVFAKVYKCEKAQNFTLWYTMPKKGVYFTIPSSDVSNDELYSASEEAIGNYAITSNVEIYDVNEYGTAGCVVSYVDQLSKNGKRSDFALKPVVICEEPIIRYDEAADEIVYEIEVIQEQIKSRNWVYAPKKYSFSSNDLVSYSTQEQKFHPSPTKWVKEGYTDVPIAELKKGDLIGISVDPETSKINGFMMIARDPGAILSNGKPDIGNWYIVADPKDAMHQQTTTNYTLSTMSKGYVIKCSGNTMYVDCGTVDETENMIARRSIYPSLVQTVILFDRDKDTVEVVKPSEIRKGDYVVTYSPLNMLTMVIRGN